MNRRIQQKFPLKIGKQSFNEFSESYLKQFNEIWNPRYQLEKFDGHTHIWDVQQAKQEIKFAQEFNIDKILAIVDANLKPALDKQFPGKFHYARFIRSENLFQSNSTGKLRPMLDEYESQGYTMIKLWFAPRWKDYAKERYNIKTKITGLQDPLFQPFFEMLEDRNIPLLIHISDPDIWYEQKYQPESYYGTKQQHLADLEYILKKYPKLTIQGAHLAAQPENLDNLERWFRTYPNFIADLSSARWMAREFSKQPQKAREFIIHNENRIFFGSDLSFGRNQNANSKSYFYTRYLTYSILFETKASNIPLPFPDAENNNQTKIVGLNLPKTSLRKIYWETAKNFFKTGKVMQ